MICLLAKFKNFIVVQNVAMTLHARHIDQKMECAMCLTISVLEAGILLVLSCKASRNEALFFHLK